VADLVMVTQGLVAEVALVVVPLETLVEVSEVVLMTMGSAVLVVLAVLVDLAVTLVSAATVRDVAAVVEEEAEVTLELCFNVIMAAVFNSYLIPLF